MERLAFVAGLFYFIFFTDLNIRVYWTLMRHKVVFYLLIILLWPTLSLKGQDVSTSGTDFWFGFMQNLDDGLPSSLEVFITSAQNASGTIEVPGQAPVNFVITPGVTFKHQIAELLNNPFAANGSGTIEQKGIHVTSDVDVSVFAFNRRRRSADASIILPTKALGSQYYVSAYFEQAPPQDIYGDRFSDSELLVVGVEDNTQIRIVPTAFTLDGKSANQPFVITLNQGEVFQLRAQGDLSGSLIETVVPQDQCTGQRFAVFGGNRWTRISTSACHNAVTTEFGSIGGAFAGDHLFEQMFPVSTWGRNFTVAPYQSRTGGYLVKMIASRANTVINMSNGQQVVLANPGDSYLIDATDRLAINASFPIQVAQYSKSLSCDLPFNEFGPGDPFMLMISPDEQTFSNITFNALSTPEIERYFLQVTAATDQTQGITLNGTNIAAQFETFEPNPTMSIAEIELNKGQDVTLDAGGGDGFIAYIYGFGPIESFGYVAGSGLADIDLQIIAEDAEIGTVNPFSCKDSSIQFYADFNDQDSRITQFEDFLWDFGDGANSTEKNPSHSYDQVGVYTVTLNASGGAGDCFREKTITKVIEVTEVVPREIIGETHICLNIETFDYSIEEDETNSFQWQVQGGDIIGATDKRVITVAWDSNATNHEVTLRVTNPQGCARSFSLQVRMNSQEALDAAIIVNHVLCHNTATGEARAVISGGKAPYTVSWSGGSSSGSQVSGLMAGEYSVDIVDASGCSVSRTFEVTQPSALELDLESTTACMSEPTATAFVLATGGLAPYTYLWEPVNKEGSEVEELTPGDYRVTVTDANGCSISSVLQVTGHRPRVSMPNVFSPNGDGQNDNFSPVFECSEALIFEMQIYNRWGQLIFRTTNPRIGWAGDYQNEALAAGVYTYQVRYSGVLNGTAFEEYYNGKVRLIR